MIFLKRQCSFRSLQPLPALLPAHISIVTYLQFNLPISVWERILEACDYITSSHLAIAFAFSTRYRPFLKLMAPINLSDVILLATSDTQGWVVHHP